MLNTELIVESFSHINQEEGKYPVLLPVYRRSDLQIVRGEGVYLYDINKNKYLDFSAGIAVNALGHCNPELVKVLTDQAKTLWHAYNAFTLPIQENLAQKLVDKSFADTVFFASTGVEVVELAIKMIRRYFYMQDKPHKYRIITIEGAFHGRSIATISSSNNFLVTEGFGPLLDGFDQVPINDITALEQSITTNTAAIMLEPIQGEGGIRIMDNDYLQVIKQICKKNDLILCFDEVQCGLGRTGSLFRYEQTSITPDIMTIAKGMGNGFPVSACLTTKKIAKAMTPGSHGSTFGGNPMAMACANKVLDIISSPKMLDSINNMSNILEKNLMELQDKYPHIIKEVLGTGLMRGIKINDNIQACTVMRKLREHRVLISVVQNNVIRITPPLIINQSHITEFIQKVENVCLEV